MRLFVAVWPPPSVAEQLRALARPGTRTVRWTTPDQWHVTLAFLGEVAPEQVPALTAALGTELAGVGGPVVAEAGPATEPLGRSVLSLPVRGLDPLAGAVRRAVAPWSPAPGPDAFSGHLTVARTRGGRQLDPGLAGSRCAARWEVDSVALVASSLERAGARYRTLAQVGVGGATIPHDEHVFGYSEPHTSPMGRHGGRDTPLP